MRGGHNIKSVEEKKRLGTSQKVRDEKRLENFVTSIKALSPPPSLSSRHLEKWEWVCNRLADHGLLTAADEDCILVYVENWIMYEDCSANVQENGTTIWVQTAKGEKPITNPAFRHLKDCETILKQLWEQFGFTPRARMGLKVEKPKAAEESAFEKMLREANLHA